MTARSGLTADLVSVIDAAPAADLGADRATWVRLATDPAVARRDTAPEHFTASAVPVTPDGTRVCLVLHAKMGLWVQPGGHFETGDRTVAAAAAREAFEETGVAVSVDPVPLVLSRHRAPCGRAEWHLDLQMLGRAEEEAPTVSAESHDVAWFDTAALPGDRAHGVDAVVAEAVRRVRRSGVPGSRSRPG